MGWEKPTPDAIQEKLVELAYVWGDIEEEIETEASRDAESDDYEVGMSRFLSDVIGRAFRVEVVYDENDFGDPCTVYNLLYDVESEKAREGAALLRTDGDRLNRLILDKADPWHSNYFLQIRVVPASTPVKGEICRRIGQDHPKRKDATLDDVPSVKPTSSVPLVERGPYHLTPIEAKFYDELAETGLTFAVQPWVEGPGARYRPDFLVFYDGESYAIELDGHEFHKTKEQRGQDAEKERWLAARKIHHIRWTGTQIYADPRACIAELMNVLRGAPARP
jgi:very-short-patch-repair endonuclease